MQYVLNIVNTDTHDHDAYKSFHSMEALMSFVHDNYTGWTSLLIVVLPYSHTPHQDLGTQGPC